MINRVEILKKFIELETDFDDRTIHIFGAIYTENYVAVIYAEYYHYFKSDPGIVMIYERVNKDFGANYFYLWEEVNGQALTIQQMKDFIEVYDFVVYKNAIPFQEKETYVFYD